MTHSFRTAAAAFLMALTAVAAQAQVVAGLGRGTKQVVDGIIVKVDNQIVLRSDLEAIYAQQQQQAEGKPLPPNLRCEILQSLTLNKLLLAKAETDSVVVDDAQVNNELNRRMSYFIQQIGSEKKLEEYYNKPLRQLKEELRTQVHEQLVQQKMQDQISGKVTVTPREVRQFFSRIPKDSIPYYSTEVEVGQIIKLAKPDDKAEQATVAKLNELRARILAGESFEALAKEFSEDPGSAKEGGYLGFFKRRELVPEYEAAALRMEPGGLSPVVKSQFGYHLIQLIEKKGDSFSSRHILLKPATGNNNVSAAAAELAKLRVRILADSISFAKAAKDVSDDKQSGANGGLLANRRDGGSRLPLDQLDPAIFFTIDTMKVGHITPPLPYRTEDGKDAVRILWLKSNTAPHQANLKDDYQKIATAALNEKKNKALDAWFEKNRGSVYLEVDPEFTGCSVLSAENK
ncbi:peptidylprolyl isomerase [Hymenobacter busanensis]|uniref:Peptidylprolyl isomerase n=1 Tax=Hymenobacter busanensis TaxID=2607656 RepID=A0A7L5A0D8_9BACT|nr:peptidylprolyl isomerase [Hymenobacter busanensis]KAA9338570.1 peptidylprolyl isomerase [Hymenobacter busanensis]QHJ09001.1 peptidylprolyl isomerase [Hymenobacter busanensis]